MKRRTDRPCPPHRRIRFINPTGQPPERWTIRRVTGGKYAIVDESGTPVLDHPDPVVRLFNRHLAKAAPVQRFALVHAQRFIELQESPFSEWILSLIKRCARGGFPTHHSGGASTIGGENAGSCVTARG